MKRAMLSDLGRRERKFRNDPNRVGDYLGDYTPEYHPTQWQLPSCRVLWDGNRKASVVLKAFVDVFDEE